MQIVTVPCTDGETIMAINTPLDEWKTNISKKLQASIIALNEQILLNKQKSKTMKTEKGKTETIGNCMKCGGRVTEEHVKGTSEKLCDCNIKQFNSTGWICPKCGARLSPYTSICPCSTQLRFSNY